MNGLNYFVEIKTDILYKIWFENDKYKEIYLCNRPSNKKDIDFRVLAYQYAESLSKKLPSGKNGKINLVGKWIFLPFLKSGVYITKAMQHTKRIIYGYRSMG